MDGFKDILKFQLLSNGGRSIEVVNEEPRESENSQTPRCGELRTELPIGNRGRKDTTFVRALVAIYAKLIYTQIFGT